MSRVISHRGSRLQTLGALLFWLGAAGAPLSFIARSLIPGWMLFAIVAGFTAISFMGIAITRRGRKLTAAARGARVLQEDPRAPVVYLRPFAADNQGAGVVSSWPLLKYGYYTDEEQLAMVLNEIGPFVAIGDPAETLPDLGAVRVYVRSGDWQAQVTDLVSRAALVIMRAGTSDGFWWEFGLVRGTVRPDRLLVLVPDDEKDYERFRAKAAEVLPHPLPAAPRGKRLMARTRTIIAFEANWRGWALPVVWSRKLESMSLASLTTPYLSRLKLTLRPIFERLGVAYSEPRLSTRSIAMSAIGFSILVVFGLLWLAFVLPQYLYTPSDDPSPIAGLPDATAEKSAYDAGLEAFGARLAGLPEYRDAFSEVTDPLAARARGRELSQKGLVRLTDEMLLERALVMRSILEAADAQTCGAIARGDPAPGLEQTLRRLTAEDVRLWFDMSFASTVAELRQAPVRPAPPIAQIENAIAELLKRVDGEEAELVRATLVNPRAGTVEEACRGARLLYQALNGMPDRSRRVLARALVTP